MSTLKPLSPSQAESYSDHAIKLRNHVQMFIDHYSKLRGITPENCNSDEVCNNDTYRALLKACVGLDEFIERI